MASVILITAAFARPRIYLLLEETATLSPGLNFDLAQANCGACHSPDYISTQPRGLPDPRAFWTAEVVKMQRAYGAPIENVDVPKIVDYLTQTYAN